MTEEQVISKKNHAGEKKASMTRRDSHHDYTERRMYMITMVVEGRYPVFGRLVGDPFAERGTSNEPRIELSALGQAVEREWLGISRYFPQIEVRAVQMMPDHLHGILFVKERLPVHLGQVISGFKAGCRKAQKALAGAEAGLALEAAEPLLTENRQMMGERREAAEPLLTENRRMMGEKGLAASPQVKALPSRNGSQPYRPLFAKGYNDLILHSYDELAVWENYLRDNPRRLLMKRARPDWLRPFFGLQIGSQTYSGIGNRQLLAAPKRMAVRVSRRLSDSEIAAETARYLEAARQGAVLVSPAISPGEKHVMRAAFDANLPTIVIMENGFTPLSKPQGEQFDACARGRLLMLAPWEHHNEMKKITSEHCRQMNLLAMEICSHSSFCRDFSVPQF